MYQVRILLFRAFHFLTLMVTLDFTFQNTHPIFSLNWECVVSFLWNTEAACPIRMMTDSDQVRLLSRASRPAAPGQSHPGIWLCTQPLPPASKSVTSVPISSCIPGSWILG